MSVSERRFYVVQFYLPLALDAVSQLRFAVDLGIDRESSTGRRSLVQASQLYANPLELLPKRHPADNNLTYNIALGV